MHTKAIVRGVLSAFGILCLILITQVVLAQARQNTDGMKSESGKYSTGIYKNTDFLEIDHLLSDITLSHSEIYISDTPQGIIIICSAGPQNNTLSNYSSISGYARVYYSNHDTMAISTAGYNNPVFNFVRASGLRQDYKNVYNYTIEPHTRISISRPSDDNYFLINPYTGKYWNKNSDDFYNKEWGQIQGLNELVIVFPRLYIK